MAYVLGFFAADGNMIRNRRGAHFIAFYSNDKIMLRMVRIVMNSNHKISARHFKPGHGRSYQMQIGSKELFHDLLKLGLTPAKSRTLRFPIIPKKYLPQFILGYFDGDGCVYFRKHYAKDRQKMRWVFTCRFTSGSRKYLEGLHEALKLYGIQRGFISDKKRGYDLVFSHADSVALYKLMYDTVPATGLYLPRKYKIFRKAIRKLYSNAAVA